MSLPPPEPRSLYTDWLVHFRASKGYDLTARVLGGGWFLLLALCVSLKALRYEGVLNLATSGSAGSSRLLSAVFLVLFYLVLCWSVFSRPPPLARTNTLLPPIVAFAATYGPWTVVLFTPSDDLAVRNFASATLILIGSLLMVVVVVHLGQAFSIVPQARILVRTGPYSLVRNPLYIAEEVALLGTLLQYYSAVTLALFILHGGLQIGRIIYEERLLRRTFPEYEEYANSTSRLIPFVW